MKSIYIENSAVGGGENRVKNISLHLLEKECCASRGAGQHPVFLSGTIFTLSAPHSLPDFPIPASRISTYDRPKTVSNHYDGLNVLFNTSMKHVRAEPIIIVYPHPQALHSLVPSDRSRGISQLRMKPWCDCSRSGFCPLGVMMAAALHRGQLLLLRSFFLSNASVFI